MNSEYSRLLSFHQCLDIPFPGSPLLLAESGFYLNLTGTQICCAFCDLSFNFPLDMPSEVLKFPMEEHHRRNPTCPFLMNTGLRPRLYTPHLPLSVRNDRTVELVRLQTFMWSLRRFSAPDRESMASSGLYYHRSSNQIKCGFCDFVTDDLDRPVPDILRRHAGISEEEEEDEKREDQKKVYCPLVRQRKLSLVDKYPDIVGNVPISETVSTCFPVYPLSESLDTRKYTFLTENWPAELRPLVYDLVMCGFQFTGLEDYVLCYWCGNMLKDWTLDDVPSANHLKYSPRCRVAFHAHRRRQRNPEEMTAHFPIEILCIVCLENHREIVFKDCGHMIACESCSSRLSNCPICRKNINEKMKVFL